MGVIFLNYLNFPRGSQIQFFSFFLFFRAHCEILTVAYWHSHIDTWVMHAKIHLLIEQIYFDLTICQVQ